MFTANKGRLALIGAVAVGAVVALSGCATSDPLAGDNSEANAASETLVIGSQAYYSNEIIAEIYAQALEAGGYTVERAFQIGQREVYLPEIEAGGIDVFPEYTGSLLQALNADAAGGNSDAVYDELVATLPEGLTALDKADASDQNSWTVTQAFADTWNLTDIASLANVTDAITIGGNSELETRPYGPATLTEKYGIAIAGFTPIEDGGGAVTIKALVDGDIQLTNVYTADPNIQSNSLVALADPDGLFFADNVVPIVSSKVDAGATDILNAVSAALSASDLVGLNAQSVNDEESAVVIATAWLTRVGLI